jgi:hypothetical protein
VYTVAVESSDHGYIASLILFKTTTENLILRLRNIGSLVPKVIQKISLLMLSYTPSEKWQSLVTPFRGVSREVPMLISDKNWLLSVEPFRGVSREMTTSGIEYTRRDHRTMVWSEKFHLHIIMGYIGSCYRRLYVAVCQGLSREVRTYAGTCQLDECRIMRPGIMYICTRSLVLMLLALGRCTVRTYEYYYWGQYPVPVVLCTVVILYLNSAEKAHMYPWMYMYPHVHPCGYMYTQKDACHSQRNWS